MLARGAVFVVAAGRTDVSIIKTFTKQDSYWTPIQQYINQTTLSVVTLHPEDKQRRYVTVCYQSFWVLRKQDMERWALLVMKMSSRYEPIYRGNKIASVSSSGIRTCSQLIRRLILKIEWNIVFQEIWFSSSSLSSMEQITFFIWVMFLTYICVNSTVNGTNTKVTLSPPA